ncbi:membrane protein insertion efficiency factor YidD [Legionella maioricensis]|uniref:Putative membrane protein insertion efficiency factor n=1 Tax=Legionella maioricensis TaxID=2896528 RepID=A0A9X2CYZ5_9GAMM|nr:membrane protein insertion efficiency factor YidD [Legionella maioricensis]MCL9683118.1 membrane protein insertion efficiency factor YidD [Legionella maioricensis]MCL9688017.1 membrane protein insertion efficiency factor YidD [Legionella maioricensis]
MGKINILIQKIVCLPIRLYQYLISPLIKPCCRFYPSCSQYAISAIKQHGVAKGIWMACKRLLRCHPWSRGGYDPVLPNDEKL